MANYDVRLLTPEGDLIDIIDNWLTLTYTKTVNEVGLLTMVLPGTYSSNLFRLDSRVAIYRNGHLELETTWLVRRVIKTLDKGGQKNIKVSAVSANELLTRRLVNADATSAEADKSDKADVMMKAYVAENLGSSASPSRNISTYLTVSSASGVGPTVDMEAAYQNLFDTLQDISQATITAGSAVFFDIVAPNQGGLTFKTYRELRGTDNSFATGNRPLILAPERGNITDVTRDYDWTGELTYIFAGGRGTGVDRAFATASSPERIGESPFNLREGWASGQTSSGSDSLQDQADAGLRAGRPVRRFSGQLVNTPQTQYGVHWNFGDKVTAEYDGEAIDCIIETVQVSVKDGKETVTGQLRVVEE